MSHTDPTSEDSCSDCYYKFFGLCNKSPVASDGYPRVHDVSKLQDAMVSIACMCKEGFCENCNMGKSAVDPRKRVFPRELRCDNCSAAAGRNKYRVVQCVCVSK